MDTKIVVLMTALWLCLSLEVSSVSVPQYSYGYDVADALTGDYKGHTEQRTGDLVTGSYSVLEPDGTRRVVDYSADPLNGFNAVVRREPIHVPLSLSRAPPVVFAPRLTNPNYYY